MGSNKRKKYHMLIDFLESSSLDQFGSATTYFWQLINAMNRNNCSLEEKKRFIDNVKSRTKLMNNEKMREAILSIEL